MNIEKAGRGKRCVACPKVPAWLVVDGEHLCSNCADTVLIKTIAKCAAAVTHAVVTFSVKPKGVLCREGKHTRSR
jgi:hypothetical protein